MNISTKKIYITQIFIPHDQLILQVNVLFFLIKDHYYINMNNIIIILVVWKIYMLERNLKASKNFLPAVSIQTAGM